MSWNSQNLNLRVDYHGGSGGFASTMPSNYVQVRDHGQYQINLEEQKKKDQDFINQFVSNVEKKQASKIDKTPIKIYEAKQKLYKIITLKKILEEKANTININDDNFDEKWALIEDQVQETKKIFNELVSNIEPLKIKLLKRLKKRKAKKRKKCKLQALKQTIKQQIKEKNIIIDKALNERKDEVEAIKREAALKRQADTVLHEVRRKKLEGSKMLNMLSALVKLRDLRIKEEEKNGGYCSKKLTDVFNEVISRFQDLWTKQLEEYKLEEKGLKIILEENTLTYAKESKFEINLLEWEKVLFGDVTNSEEEKLLTSADYDLEAFLQVRRDWDNFLVNDSTAVSSSIPLGWVLPPESNDENWKQYLVKSKGS